MKHLILFVSLCLSMQNVQAQDQFEVTVQVDSAIASVPQKVYMYSLIEQQWKLHDSIAIDSTHREGTMHGSVPYEYNVNLMFARRGPQIVPIVVKNGDRMKIRIGDEDDGFRFRYINKVEGSPSTLEYVNYQMAKDSLRREMVDLRAQMNLYGISDDRLDSLKRQYQAVEEEEEMRRIRYAQTGVSAYGVAEVVDNVCYMARKHPEQVPYTEAEADAMMNTLADRFPGNPLIKALLNDSTLGPGYMPAETFAVFYGGQLRRMSPRLYDAERDTTVCPLKVGDYMNLELGGGNPNQYRGRYVLVDFWASWCGPCIEQMPNIKLAAEMFADDFLVCLVSMDKTSKEWWQATKKYELKERNNLKHLSAYDRKTGEMYPAAKRLGIEAIPHNYLVNREGRIIARNISPTLMIDRLKELIAKEQRLKD